MYNYNIQFIWSMHISSIYEFPLTLPHCAMCLAHWNVFILISLRCVGVRGLLPMALVLVYANACVCPCVFVCVCGECIRVWRVASWFFHLLATSLQLVALRLWFAAFNRRTSNAARIAAMPPSFPLSLSLTLSLPVLQMISLNCFIISQSATRGRSWGVEQRAAQPWIEVAVAPGL